MLGEVPDVVAQGLIGFLLAVLEVPRIARAHVCALKVVDEHLPEVCPVADGVGRQELQPGADVLSQEDWEILDDEAVVVRSSGPAREPIIFQPHTGVRVPDILHDVCRWLEALEERSPTDRLGEGARSGGVWARAPVVIDVRVAGASPTPEW